MPTIREIAESCGVTKQTVTSRLHDLGLWEGHVQKDGRAFVVDAEAASAVAASIRRKRTADTDSGADSAALDGNAALEGAMAANEALKTALSASQETVAALTRQLDAKDAQIRSLNDRLADLNDRLAAAQDAQGRAQATIDRLSSRSWLGRLLGRGLPAPK